MNPRKASQDGKVQKSSVVQDVTVFPLEAKLVQCKLIGEDGSTIGPNTFFVGDVNGVSVAAVTDNESKVKLYVHNTTDQDSYYVRGHQLGIAEEEDQFVYNQMETEEDVVHCIQLLLRPDK